MIPYEPRWDSRIDGGSYLKKCARAKSRIRSGKDPKPKGERDSTPVTYRTARYLAYLPRERTAKQRYLSEFGRWFDGPNFTGCVLMAKPKAGTDIYQYQSLPLLNLEDGEGDIPELEDGDDAAASPRKKSSNAKKAEDETAQPNNDSGDDEGPTQVPINSSALPSPILRLPRGLIILSRKQLSICSFHGGFEYPKAVLSGYHIPKEDWATFCRAVAAPVRRHKQVHPSYFSVSYPEDWSARENKKTYLQLRCAIDDVLDVVAEWDQNYFRPRGLIMRMDMPGEAKYGLTFMDVSHKGHIDNCSGVLSRKVQSYEDGRYLRLSKKDRHLSRVLEMCYCSTRIVVDDIEVLQNKKLSEERGWAEWERICRRARSKPPPGPDAKIRTKSGKQFDSRWPHEKKFFYERYRGELQTHNVVPPTAEDPWWRWVWHAAHDSLDRREGHGISADRAVLPTEGVPSDGIRRDFIVYWQKWAIGLLKKDGYYLGPASNPQEGFVKGVATKR